jgi:DNA-3-methyladenine glycosylase I
MDKSTRCFGNKDPIMADYHDIEWGVPLHEDRELFELIILEGAQAGLSWRTILHRREAYREAFIGFNPQIVAGFTPERLEDIRLNSGIIKNRMKIASAVKNAKGFLEIQREFGSFDKYIWGFVDYKPVMNRFNSWKEVPAKTELSERITKDLKKRGFTFVGPTIVYAYMQSIGMVNDHLVTCFRYQQIVDEFGQ